MPLRLGSFLVSAATALVLLAGSIVPFLSTGYIHLEQERTGVEQLTDYDGVTLVSVTGSIVHDLLLGGDFGVAANGAPVLDAREQAHMRDVRGVFQGFFALVALGIGVLAVAFLRTRRGGGRAAARASTWRAVAAGARGLVIALAVAGVFAIFAFDAAFEVFHRLFFSAGTYDFDPRTERLVQLFPDQFWSETSIAVGAVAIVAALVTAWAAGRRAGALEPATLLSTSRART